MSAPKDIDFLILEDMSFYQSLIVQSLQNQSFEGRIYLTKSYKQALEKIQSIYNKKGKIQFIICDLFLPDGSGKDLIKIVRKNPHLKNIPILMLTTEEAPEAIVECFELGADSYSFKPINEDDLLEKINFCWNKRASL